MPPNLTHIFPQDFLNKIINFPKETLANLFNLSRKAVHRFANKQLYYLDPLVCENACHIRAFTLWHMVNKYQTNGSWQIWHLIIDSLDEIIQKINSLPQINKHTKESIENFLQEHHLYLELDNDIIFDIKFIFLSHLLTLTKKQFPSSSFILHEKTCLEELNELGLVHNKIKSLISSAQKELSAMSCQFIQRQSKLCKNEALIRLLETRYDNHKRSYLPQYSTAKVILLNALENNTPLIIKVSRFVQHQKHDELILGFIPSPDKKEFHFTTHINDQTQAAIIFRGVINYEELAEHPNIYISRLNQYPIIQVLLANFAAHPQFSGNLKHTPCIYKEAIETFHDLKPHIAQEWEKFNQHTCFAKKEGCSLENPNLLFLIHVFCDSVTQYNLHALSTLLPQETLLDENEL